MHGALSMIEKNIPIHNKKTEAEDAKDPIKLRDYQEEAIAAWVANDYHGFYVMATGTGKTWTAIFSAKKLLEQHPAMVVICAPYKHLVRQWADDVIKAFPDAKIVMVSSENAKWESQLSDLIIRKKYQKDLQIIVISTIASFKMQRFNKTLGYSREQKLLIVDEAHRFTERPDALHKQFQYMLGLSATPFSGSSAQKGQELMKFFGGQVFSLPIESALERGFLVPYYYYPIYVNATDSEVAQFRSFNQKILSCFKNGRCINPDLLVKSLRGRLRVISMSSEKMENIDRIVDQIDEKDHIVVYCGDGKLFDNQTGAELRHIQAIKKVLAQHEYKASQFTATESMDDRMELVDAFNKGEITALAAIRCLDEGINIPSIKSAYKANQKILHSTQCSKEDEQFLIQYWRLLSDNIEEWQDVMNKHLAKKSLREDYIISLSITINAFGRLGRVFYKNRDYDMEFYLCKLKNIDWMRSNPIWMGRTIRENGKVQTSDEAIILTCSAIKKSIGLPLSRDEENKENHIIK